MIDPAPNANARIGFAHLTEEGRERPGVDEATVVLDTGAAAITSEPGVDDAEVRTAVKEAGYDLI